MSFCSASTDQAPTPLLPPGGCRLIATIKTVAWTEFDTVVSFVLTSFAPFSMPIEAGARDGRQGLQNDQEMKQESATNTRVSNTLLLSGPSIRFFGEGHFGPS